MAGLHATIGVLAALHKRHETGRGQHVEVNLLSSALSGLVNHSSAYVAGGRGAVPDGQQPPEPVPVRAAALRRRRPDHHRRQRRPVPQAVRGARSCPSWPTTRASPTTRTAPPTATSCGRCWWSGCRPGPSRSGSTRSSPPACRADRSTPSTPGWPSPRRSGWTRWSRSARRDARCRSVRNPITLSETPAATGCRRPGLDEHGAEIRAWLEDAAASSNDQPTVPHLARHLRRRPHPAARARTWPTT